MRIFNNGATCTIETNEEILDKVFMHNAFDIASGCDDPILFIPSGKEELDMIWHNFFTDNEIEVEILKLGAVNES